MRYVLLAVVALSSSCHAPPPWISASNCPTTDLSPAILNQLFTSIDQGKRQIQINDLSSNTTFCIAFVTASDNSYNTKVTMGKGNGINKAVADAIRQFPQQHLISSRHFKLDLVDQVVEVDINNTLLRPRSLWGLATGSDQQTALLPDEVLAGRIISNAMEYRPDRLVSWLEWNPERLSDNDPVWQYRFSTRSWYWHADEAKPLYRGHFLAFDLSEQALLESISEAADYLTRSIDEDGRFVYNYLPKTDQEGSGYNILRHAGTLYSLLEWYQERPNPELLAAVERGLNYLWRQTGHCQGADVMRIADLICIVEDGEIKLGGNALAVLAMTEHHRITNDPRWLEPATALAGWLLHNQSESGEFSPHKWLFPSGEASDFVSGYYPGEALYALTRLYQSDPDTRWLDAANRGADWLINVRDAGKSVDQLDHDHWLMYALWELHQLSTHPDYLQHAFRITDAILSSQNLELPVNNSGEFDWHGSYYRPPRTTPTATRSEALINAARLAADTGNQKFPAIANGLCAATRFQLQTQFRPENSLYLPNPKRALGGFHRGLETFGTRIDYVQHNISAMLGMVNLQRADLIDCSSRQP